MNNAQLEIYLFYVFVQRVSTSLVKTMVWCILCVPCLFINFYQIHEALFGNGQHMDYENYRFVCTSMKRGLAMFKIWIMNIVFLLLVSVRYNVSSQDTFWQLPGMKYAKSYSRTAGTMLLYWFKLESGAIPSQLAQM